MTIRHPVLKAASTVVEAAAETLGVLVSEIDETPPTFRGVVAINLWSPYLPAGRHTELQYPSCVDGKRASDEHGGKEKLAQIHERYLTLLGRNLSANHLFVELPEVKRLEVDTKASVLAGPSTSLGEDGESGEASANASLFFRIPLASHSGDPCFDELVPQADYREWVGWISDESFDRRYKEKLRDALLECRQRARRALPKAFASHLYTWLRRGWVPGCVGLGNFDDRWLARIQLTSLAAAIWGDRWVSSDLGLGEVVSKRLSLSATCTVAGFTPEGGNHDEFASLVDDCAEEWSRQVREILARKLVEIEGQLDDPNPLPPWAGELRRVEKHFAIDLGGSLISADHEGEPVTLRGVLTPGLDALPLEPAEMTVLHEILPSELGVEELGPEELEEWWNLWKAYFGSNDLFLGKPGVVLQFELRLSSDGEDVVPMPRHVLRLSTSLDAFLERIGLPPPGLLQMGFQSDQKMALHRRALAIDEKVLVETRAQLPGIEFYWPDRGSGHDPQADWGELRGALMDAFDLIRGELGRDEFFKPSAESLNTLSSGQLVQLADGVTEVRRLNRGCLVFAGPTGHAADGSHWFIDPSEAKRLVEITRLGVAFGILSQIPETYSEDFRTRFADAVSMDGETVVCACGTKVDAVSAQFEADFPPGSLHTGRFLQLPEGTPSLIDLTKPRISKQYVEAWQRSAHAIKEGYLKDRKGVTCRPLGKLNQSQLLSLGTRHRKAAMATHCLPWLTGLTSSASGKIRVWIRGVPIVEIEPNESVLLPRLPPPDADA